MSLRSRNNNGARIVPNNEEEILIKWFREKIIDYTYIPSINISKFVCCWLSSISEVGLSFI